MADEEPAVAIVTLSKDNPDELKVTAKSVAMQTVAPDYFVVVDSSSKELRQKMQGIAESAGATYRWVRPEGIYSAMRLSMAMVPDDTYVWWLNSSDWLSGSESIEQVKCALVSESDRDKAPLWLVGGLLRRVGEKVAAHGGARDGADFVKKLTSGQIGFPHPSTVFWKPALSAIKPYEEAFSVAADYSTALRFSKAYGPPLLVKSPLSIHVPTGFSYRFPVTGFVEKSRARIATFGKGQVILELVRFPVQSLRGVLNRLTGNVGVPLNLEALRESDEFPGHFCDRSSEKRWPFCCDKILGYSGVGVAT